MNASYGNSPDALKRDAVRAWLESWGFVDNPFALWNAGIEPRLEEYFVKRPFFDQLLNDPRSTLVFAPRGGGKSATRIMIQSESRPAAYTSSIFAVSFTDFSPFLESHSQLPQLTLADYLPHLFAVALPTLLKALAVNPESNAGMTIKDVGELNAWLERYANNALDEENLRLLFNLADSDLEQATVSALIDHVYHGVSLPSHLSVRLIPLVRFLHQLYTYGEEPFRLVFKSPSEEVKAFIQFALRLLNYAPTACRAIYFLIDGVDEYPLTQHHPETTAELLRPLLGNLPFLELPGLAVKFFLPVEQRAALEQAARTDRLDVISLAWETMMRGEESELLFLLRRRIAAFNTMGRRGLGELCHPSLKRWLEEAMVLEAQGSPRNLMRLGNMIFAEHCRDMPPPKSVCWNFSTSTRAKFARKMK
ncbi:hypothetical protein HY772_04225 [Candidatus Woesearchaeota archaeon]|nr:hypothetical protein [Candidatus Woesearchaeota archaeon]